MVALSGVDLAGAYRFAERLRLAGPLGTDRSARPSGHHELRACLRSGDGLGRWRSPPRTRTFSPGSDAGGTPSVTASIDVLTA